MITSEVVRFLSFSCLHMPVAEIAIQLYEREKNSIPIVLADLILVLSYWM